MLKKYIFAKSKYSDFYKTVNNDNFLEVISEIIFNPSLKDAQTDGAQ